MKLSIKSTEHIGKIIKMARVSQGLDQFSAASLSGVGQSFLSHLENGKETAQIGKVLEVLTSLGVRIELALPSDFDPEVFKAVSGAKEKVLTSMGPIGMSARFGKFPGPSSDAPAPDAEQVFEYMDKIMSTRVKRP